MKRQYSFDVLKFVFSIMIALYHFGVSIPGVSCAVQFFFMISGYFLGRKIYVNRGETPWQYTAAHVRSLYPQYLLGLISLYLYHGGYEIVHFLNHGVFSHRWIGDINELTRFVSELLFLQNSGLFSGGLNYPLWQVCALLISGHFLYAAFYHNRKLAEDILVPVTVLLALTWISANGIGGFDTVGMFYIPLLRAYIWLACGIMIYRFTQSRYYAQCKKCLNWLSAIALVLLIVYRSTAALTMVLCGVILLALNDGNSWLNKLLNHENAVSKSLGKLSYAIYVNHALFIFVMLDIIDPLLRSLAFYNEWVRACVFTVLLVVYSIATVKLVVWIKKNKQKKAQQLMGA